MGSKNSKSSMRLIPYLVIILILSLSLSAKAEEAANIDLTPEEVTRLAEHPEIKFMAETLRAT